LSKPHRYVIELSSVSADLIREVHAEAERDGHEAEFSEALLAINDRLQIDPGEFGDERFHVSGIDVEVRVAMIRPVAVEYGVSHSRRVVIFRRLWYLQPAG
jgi:hypothetical protein